MSKRSVVSFVTFSVAITLVLGLIPWLWLDSFDGAGSLGDWIAGSTTLIVQAVVIYLLYETYRSQKSELEEQRMLLDVANKEAARKRFEDGYYMLLERYETIVRGLVLPGNDTYKARHVFPDVAADCIGYHSEEDVQTHLIEYFTVRDWWLGDWVRVVLMAVKYVRESDRTDGEQQKYLKLLRGSMSSAESRAFLMYLLTREKDKSKTATFLLANNFFKYSQVSKETSYPKLKMLVHEIHGMPVYPKSANREKDTD